MCFFRQNKTGYFPHTLCRHCKYSHKITVLVITLYQEKRRKKKHKEEHFQQMENIMVPEMSRMTPTAIGISVPSDQREVSRSLQLDVRHDTGKPKMGLKPSRFRSNVIRRTVTEAIRRKTNSTFTKFPQLRPHVLNHLCHPYRYRCQYNSCGETRHSYCRFEGKPVITGHKSKF